MGKPWENGDLTNKTASDILEKYDIVKYSQWEGIQSISEAIIIWNIME